MCGNCNEALDVSGAPQEVNTERYIEVLTSSPVPVVVDFWAEWAPPCQMADPVVEQFARRHAGKVLVVKVNSDKAPQLLAQLGIEAVPTFQAIQGGEELARHGGVLPQDAFDRWADRAFTRPAA
ncbi:MAG: thioredoxin [Myxococcaceae bacterium]|nr:thioredoxin [Myxococcaceae bacterium]